MNRASHIRRFDPVSPETFEFCSPGRVIFGLGEFSRVWSVAKEHGERPLVVVGSNPARYGPPIEEALRRGVLASVLGEPDFDTVRRITEQAVNARCDSVLAIGGGSVIDTGKAVAMLVTNGGDPLDYAEVIGSSKPVAQQPLPCIAVPTTAGAGAEVTRNAVLRSREHGVKVSLRSARMVPAIALIDPGLASNLPPQITASTGLDALSQLLEPFVSSKSNPLTDMYCRDGLARVGRSLLAAFRDGTDLSARSDMALAALHGGIALTNAGLGAVHGFAAPIGGLFEAPHGAVCAALLAPVMAANLQHGDTRVTDRYAETACLLSGETEARAGDAIRWVENLTRALGIPSLRAYGVKLEHIDLLCERASATSSMRGNPVQLNRQTLRETLLRAL